MDIYKIIFWSYLGLALLTLVPTFIKLLGKVPLNPGGASFESASHNFSDINIKKLKDHYSRIEGTLGFWKRKAELYTSFHYYCIGWMIFSSWAVPIISALSPEIATSSSFAKYLIILVSGHVALALSFHKGLGIADGMKAFRHGESEFYDLYRRLLDRPHIFGENEQKQIDTYFAEVERVRRLVRNAETESLPTVENIKSIEK